MEDKIKDKVFYTLASVSFSLLSVAYVVANNSVAGIGFGTVAFILGVKAIRIKK